MTAPEKYSIIAVTHFVQYKQITLFTAEGVVIIFLSNLRSYVLKLQGEFLQNHLMIWVPEYCQILMEASRVDFYQQRVHYLHLFLADIKDQH